MDENWDKISVVGFLVLFSRRHLHSKCNAGKTNFEVGSFESRNLIACSQRNDFSVENASNFIASQIVFGILQVLKLDN